MSDSIFFKQIPRLDEGDSRLLQADLAAMRGALERMLLWFSMSWGEYVARYGSDSDHAMTVDEEFRRLVTTALSPSCGSAWLAWGREVYAAMRASDPHRDAPNLSCPLCVLLARAPEGLRDA